MRVLNVLAVLAVGGMTFAAKGGPAAAAPVAPAATEATGGQAAGPIQVGLLDRRWRRHHRHYGYYYGPRRGYYSYPYYTRPYYYGYGPGITLRFGDRGYRRWYGW